MSKALGQSMRMKKWGTISAITALAIFAVADFVHDAVTNDPIGYFRRDPGQLLYVAGIAIVGGLLTMGYHKLPSRTQRRVRMFGSGAIAIAATAAVGYLTFVLCSLASMISGLGLSVWPVLTMLPFLL